MTISSGNLDSLVGMTLPTGDITGIVVETFTADTVSPGESTITSLTGIATGAPSLGVSTGQTIDIIAVDDATNTITYNEMVNDTPLATLSDEVIGFNPDALLLADATTPENAADYVDLSQGEANELIGALSFSPIATATSLSFSASGTTDAPACFARGTRILTNHGEIEVEKLSAGMAVQVLHGSFRQIKRLGVEQCYCNDLLRPEAGRPIQVLPDAFADNVPHRDLFLSPDHAVFLDEVLIPIKHLLNGVSIRQMPISRVEYWHVELDRHDVIFAAGLAAESYLYTGMGCRDASAYPTDASEAEFSNWVRDAMAYAPLVVTGPKLAMVRAKLNSRIKIILDATARKTSLVAAA